MVSSVWEARGADGADMCSFRREGVGLARQDSERGCDLGQPGADVGAGGGHGACAPGGLLVSGVRLRYGETEAVVNGVASHHNDVPPVGPLGILVSAADAISASRPGARSENTATYLKRIEDLEKIASSLAGVEKAFAVQAGRELRVFVQPEKVNDEEAFALARNIAAKIQNELQYPGQIKITVIRETRCVEVAK